MISWMATIIREDSVPLLLRPFSAKAAQPQWSCCSAAGRSRGKKAGSRSPSFRSRDRSQPQRKCEKAFIASTGQVAVTEQDSKGRDKDKDKGVGVRVVVVLVVIVVLANFQTVSRTRTRCRCLVALPAPAAGASSPCAHTQRHLQKQKQRGKHDG